MTLTRSIERDLSKLVDSEHYLFTLRDLAGLMPGRSEAALKALVGRLTADGVLERLCRGLYLYPGVHYPSDLVLYHSAARLRADALCYLSLESVLSDAGVISQIPMNWITLMTSGRSGELACGRFGMIEFIHTRKSPESLAGALVYDSRCRLWRATVAQAMIDMRDARRSMELVNLEVLNELV